MRLWRQRRRIVITTLLAVPLWEFGPLGPEGGRTLLSIGASMVIFTLFQATIVLVRPQWRKMTLTILSCSATLIVMDFLAPSIVNAPWGGLGVLVGAAVIVPPLLRMTADQLLASWTPRLRSERWFPLPPDAAITAYVGLGDELWDPTVVHVARTDTGFTKRFHPGIAGGALVHNEVIETGPGLMRSIVTFEGGVDEIADWRCDLTLEARAVADGSLLTLTERTHGLPFGIAADIWLDDALGSQLDVVAALMDGTTGHSVSLIAYREAGIEVDADARVF